LNQLVDFWRGVGKPLPGVDKEQGTSKHLNRDACEKIVIHLLTKGVMKEKFHHTPYSTISYLMKGPQANQVMHNKFPITIAFREPLTGETGAEGSAQKKRKRADIVDDDQE